MRYAYSFTRSKFDSDLSWTCTGSLPSRHRTGREERPHGLGEHGALVRPAARAPAAVAVHDQHLRSC